MPDNDDLVEVVITAPDEDWLVAFTRRLIGKRLAACGHHMPIRSVYIWDGEAHDQRETHVALHTRAGHFEAIVALTNAEHPYEVPCVISMPIKSASLKYREWVLSLTG